MVSYNQWGKCMRRVYTFLGSRSINFAIGTGGAIVKRSNVRIQCVFKVVYVVSFWILFTEFWYVLSNLQVIADKINA